MKVCFYPGCALHGTGREYGESIYAISQNLDIQLEELEDWSCCGASSGHTFNEALAIALPGRNLALAEKIGATKIVTPCPACFVRLKIAEKKLKVNEFHPDLGFTYSGEIQINHLLEYLSEPELLKKIRTKITRPLHGLRVVCYYGCLTVRPPKMTDAKHPENPQDMDKLMELLGAQPLPWSFKTDCCGGSLTLTRIDIVRRLVNRLFRMAIEAGADCIVTACPLCQVNLDTREAEAAQAFQQNYKLPVYYFTELLGLALGLPGIDSWLARHIVNPRKLLEEKGLIRA
ncbi:MAG TPA: CoB--CoM heterodisulfide reductase iron-sulfur subunit B family protein [Thermodesulfobacteriota bacterium]|nr:CoB--CoM heterodisulfide reductase iron-sulfur subunit B family protein [Thermodesulfobacteriota bacterium]